MGRIIRRVNGPGRPPGKKGQRTCCPTLKPPCTGVYVPAPPTTSRSVLAHAKFLLGMNEVGVADHLAVILEDRRITHPAAEIALGDGPQSVALADDVGGRAFLALGG